MIDNEKVLENVKLKISISNFETEEHIEMRKNNRNIFKIVTVACCMLVLTTGIVFAKDIERFVRERFNFGLGRGVDQAAENGYISEPEMPLIESQTEIKVPENDLGTIVDDINVSAKIDSFLMDDYNLSVEFAFEFDEEIQKFVDFNKLDQITLNDLMVLDEEKRIIYASNSMGEEKFSKFCNEHQLEFKYGECNENYMNNGLNWFPQNISKTSNKAGLVYNMYTEGYPKSKELDFYFKEITITEQEYEGENRITRNVTLTGDWNMHVDVPEKMYNRTSESYRVISCENDRFDVYAAKVMDTGFEIGIMISDMVRPEYPEIFAKKQKEVGFGKEWEEFVMENEKLWNDYQRKAHPINNDGINMWLVGEARNESAKGCYVINSDGEEFRSTMSPSRKYNQNFVKGNQLDFYETFGMTKYDATDKITVVIEFFGEPVKIELEKIK